MYSAFLVQAFLVVEGIVLSMLLMPYISRFTAPIVEGVLTLLRLPLKILFGILCYFTFDSFADMRRLQLKFGPSVNPAEGTMDSSNAVSMLSAKCETERNFYMYAFALSLFMIIIRLESILMIYRDAKRKVENYEIQKYQEIAAKKKSAESFSAATKEATHA